MTVPFLDLARLHASIRADLDEVFSRTLADSSFIGGGAVEAFEEAFATAHGRAAAAGCGSGTDALALALRALGVGPGDEVVVPSMTFVATAEAVCHVGAEPVIADVDPDTLLLGADEVAAVRTDRTRVVMPVHLYGHVVPLDLLDDWRADGLVVVEDAAQAHLATWRGRSVGDASSLACFSFYPGKNLGALGDAGLVVSDDTVLIDDVRRLADHGRQSKYTHDVVGWCSRLDGLQAGFLHAKLAHLPEWTEGRRRVAARYAERLGECESARLVPWEAGAVHHLLVVRVPAEERERIASGLQARGVGSGIHYPVPLSEQPALSRWHRSTPVAEQAGREVLSLPMDPLMTEHDVDEVCDALLGVLK